MLGKIVLPSPLTMQTIALRLQPQQDLKLALDTMAQSQQLEAACIVTCVGSLSQATLRFAHQSTAAVYQEYFEIVSLTGTLSRHGSHYHIAIADRTGRTIGGHLLAGNLIYTTAEVVIAVLPQFSFKREPDSVTGFNELTIYPLTSESSSTEF